LSGNEFGDWDPATNGVIQAGGKEERTVAGWGQGGGWGKVKRYRGTEKKWLGGGNKIWAGGKEDTLKRKRLGVEEGVNLVGQQIHSWV